MELVLTIWMVTAFVSLVLMGFLGWQCFQQAKTGREMAIIVVCVIGTLLLWSCIFLPPIALSIATGIW